MRLCSDPRINQNSARSVAEHITTTTRAPRKHLHTQQKQTKKSRSCTHSARCGARRTQLHRSPRAHSAQDVNTPGHSTGSTLRPTTPCAQAAQAQCTRICSRYDTQRHRWARSDRHIPARTHTHTQTQPNHKTQNNRQHTYACNRCCLSSSLMHTPLQLHMCLPKSPRCRNGKIFLFFFVLSLFGVVAAAVSLGRLCAIFSSRGSLYTAYPIF